MEMVEEGQNQPKIWPKRIKFKEIEEKGGVDRVSALPDCLLLEILSRLPSTGDAIRTDYKLPRSDFFSFVDKTLTERRQLKLKKLGVYTVYDIPFESQVNKWIRYAISCNFEELILKLNTVSDAKCELYQSVYISSCFTAMKLEGCILNPTGAISWKNLRSLSITKGKFDEDLIKNILSGSPVLETLVLDYCYGYRLLNMTSKGMKKLVFSGYTDPDAECYDLADIIKINALTIRGELLLWQLLLLNVSSVVEAELNFIKIAHCETTTMREEEEMLRGFIRNLYHVKELKIGVCCLEVFSWLEAKGFISPSHIKFLDDDYERMELDYWSGSESDNGPKADEDN